MVNNKPSAEQAQKFLGLIGKSASAVILACDTKRGVTEDVVVNKTGLKLSEVRNVLNQLHDKGLIRYNREKNQNTNLYTYTWFTYQDGIDGILRDL
jgi:transcription initiation factor IIE alpha subunit